MSDPATEPSSGSPTGADLVGARLVAEAGSKSDVAWLGPIGGRQVGLWCEWHDDALLVVTGGDEQPDPGLVDASLAVVTLRSKDKGVRLVTFDARVSRVRPGTSEWDAAAPVLKQGRLNSVDAPTVLQRWAQECSLWRLTPTGTVAEQPGTMPTASWRAVPVPTSATTAGDPPLMIGRTPPRRPGDHL